MAHIEFGVPERALLLALMALGGTADNPTLKARVGTALDGEARRKMNDLKLVSSEKRGRSYHHTLEEDGWAWCVAELSAEPPAARSSLGRTLYVVLGMLRDRLDRADLSLAEFVTADSLSLDESAESAEAAEPAPVPAPVSDEELENRVRAAYFQVAARPGSWVSLTAVRAALGDAPRDRVDDVLRRMERGTDVFIAPESDQKSLTAEDRAAAVRVGDRDKHLLAIGVR
ncbi:hypothetical protein [Actinocorallia sp. A-T 12471]|uniref:hypothetical protein n=1 Tax=Actinocorallia sp. A-T 12471 TaxID=3089813 RepID=UPI0029CD880C|nr:hypothetical protein [Actinocorallia sp. A-T 12471]MDX6742980.1 hypothetical protein [Actinocorallia sp. A-T 12471]